VKLDEQYFIKPNLVFMYRCNPAGIKRTWQQLKMKYKNILQAGKP